MRHDPFYRFGRWLGYPIGKAIAYALWYTLPRHKMIDLAERKGWISAYEAKQARAEL